jgi:hypothetical protein
MQGAHACEVRTVEPHELQRVSARTLLREALRGRAFALPRLLQQLRAVHVACCGVAQLPHKLLCGGAQLLAVVLKRAHAHMQHTSASLRACWAAWRAVLARPCCTCVCTRLARLRQRACALLRRRDLRLDTRTGCGCQLLLQLRGLSLRRLHSRCAVQWWGAVVVVRVRVCERHD